MRAPLSSLDRLVAVLAVLLSPSLAWAQSAPTPNLRGTTPAWMGLMIIFFLLVIVVTVSLMSSKRGHQD